MAVQVLQTVLMDLDKLQPIALRRHGQRRWCRYGIGMQVYKADWAAKEQERQGAPRLSGQAATNLAIGHGTCTSLRKNSREHCSLQEGVRCS
jgi:hypothetical protein